MIEFAENIQEALSSHAHAMGTYEAKEVVPCKELRSLPSAKMYLVDGEEKLMVSDDSAIGVQLETKLTSKNTKKTNIFGRFGLNKSCFR